MSLASGVAALATRVATEFNTLRGQITTELAGKADDSAVVKLAGTQTVTGAKTFSAAPSVPTPGSPGNPVRNDDSRLSDTRAPVAGSVVNASVAGGAAIDETKLALASDAAAGVASRRTLGTGSTQAAAGNHTHSQYAPIASPTFTGTVTLPGDPGSALGAATKQYVDNHAGTHVTNRSVSAATTAVVGELLEVNAAGSAITITPPSSPAVGDQVTVVKTDATGNVVTWAGTTDGDTSALITSPWAAATFCWDGTQWILWSSNVSTLVPAAGSTPMPVTLAYAGTIAVNASLGNEFRITATGNPTISVPTNGADGQKLLFVVTASGAARTVTMNGSYEVGGVVTSRTVAIASGLTAYIGVHNRNGTYRLLAVDDGS